MDRVSGVCSEPVWRVVVVSMRAIQVSSSEEVLWRVPRGTTKNWPERTETGPPSASERPMRTVTTENEEHLVLVVMGVPGELSLNLCHFDVLVVDLTDDSR